MAKDNRRESLTMLFAIAFFLIGGTIVYSLVKMDSTDGDKTACWNRGGVPVQAVDKGEVVCIDPSALR
jgi:hypothetical protein